MLPRKALIASGCPHGTTTLYRCVHLAEQLAALGAASRVRQWYGGEPIPEEIRDADLIVLHRVAMSHTLSSEIDRAQARGALVLFDTDDLVFEPSMTHWHRAVTKLSAEDQLLYHEGVSRYLSTLEACDYVLVSTPLLAELAQQRRKTAFVHRNAMGLEMSALAVELYANRRQSHIGERIIIGYGSGTATHDIDFHQAKAALIAILSRYSHVHLCLVGPLDVGSEFEAFGTRVARREATSWQEWMRIASSFDINLAPLEPGNPFCRAKSEIKVTEAAALGVPSVASRIDPYEHVIDQGINGLLADSEVEWIDALTRLVEDVQFRQRLGTASRHHAMRHYSPSARTSELGRILDQLELSGSRDRRPARSGMEGGSTGVEPAGPGASSDTSGALVLNWLIPEPFRGSGGHANLFRMIRHLTDFGHTSRVYLSTTNQSAEDVARFVDTHFGSTGATFHTWPMAIADADATFATFWTTAYDVAQSSPNAGRRYYLVQDFEPYFYSMGSEWIAAENTYRLGLHCITLGRWLAGHLGQHYGAEANYFDFAVDSQVYRRRQVRRPSRPRVAFYARPSTPRRGFALGTAALSLIKEARPDVEVVLFGADELAPPPFEHTNAGVLDEEGLAALYSSCDVGLVLSLTNPSLVPLEMLACGCAVVDVQSDRLEGVLRHNEDAWLCQPTPRALADGVLRVISDPQLHRRITEVGFSRASRLAWLDSARQIERVLLQHAPPLNQRAASRRPRSSTKMIVSAGAASDPVCSDVVSWSAAIEPNRGVASPRRIDVTSSLTRERLEFQRLWRRVVEMARQEGITAVLAEVVPYLRFRYRTFRFHRN